MAHDPTRFFPAKGSPESTILAYRDRQINRFSLFRNYHMGRVALSMWYYLGRQWAEFDVGAAFQGVRGAILRDMTDDGHARPVTNEVSPAVEQEVINLVKRGWQPKVTPNSPDPRIKAAAQVNSSILNYQLSRMQWDDKRRELGVYYVTGGTGLIYTAWDKSYAELRTIAVPGAMICSGCSTRLFSPEVPVDTLQLGINGSPVKHLETADDVALDTDDLARQGEPMQLAKLNYCPTCDQPTPLQPYTPTPDEAEFADDIFGRPLGMMEPRGTAALEIDLPHEFYPENGGFRVTPNNIRRWSRRKIRSLEWWEEHAPHIVDEIDADPIGELAYDDPILGDWNMIGGWSPAYDAGILDHHANADEMVELPSFRHPLGRYVLCSKSRVVIDEDLLQKCSVEDVDGNADEMYVARCNIAISRYKIRPTEMWGTNLPEEIISPQNRLNTMDSQVVEERERLGGVSLMMTPGMWVDDDIRTVEGRSGAARFVFFNPDPNNPDIKQPIPFGGQLFNAEVYQERDRVQKDIRHIAFANPAGQGDNPTGVGNTSQLQLLIEQDEKMRALREDDLIRSVERAWTHISQMEWGLRTDPDVYRVMGSDKAWKYEQYVGSMIRGQVEISIEKQSYIAKSIMEREAAREAIADGLVVIDGPVARRRVLEKYGLDTNINEDTNNQVDQAERQWVDFVDKDIVRVQDSVDDPAIRYQVLGTHLLTDEGQQLTLAANWDEINRAIAGWELEFANLELAEQKSIAFYGGRLSGQDAAVAFAQATLQYQKSLDDYNQQQAIFIQQQQEASRVIPGAIPPPPPMPPGEPPTPPPVPVMAPVLLQDRILTIWTGMCSKQGIVLDPAQQQQPGITAVMQQPVQEKRFSYVKLRALVESYRRSILPGTVSPGTGTSFIPVDKGGAAMSAAPPQQQPQPQPQPPAPKSMAPMPEGGKQ